MEATKASTLSDIGFGFFNPISYESFNLFVTNSKQRKVFRQGSPAFDLVWAIMEAKAGSQHYPETGFRVNLDDDVWWKLNNLLEWDTGEDEVQ